MKTYYYFDGTFGDYYTPVTLSVSRIKHGRFCYTSSDCREAHIREIRKACLVRNDGHFFTHFKRARSKEEIETYKKVCEIAELKVSIYGNKHNVYVAGDMKDFTSFDYGLSFLFYLIKYRPNLDWLFDESLITNKIIGGSYNGQSVRFFTSFYWYMVFMKGFKDFSHPAQGKERTRRVNGIDTYIRRVFFLKYPENIKYLKEYFCSGEISKTVHPNNQSSHVEYLG